MSRASADSRAVFFLSLLALVAWMDGVIGALVSPPRAPWRQVPEFAAAPADVRYVQLPTAKDAPPISAAASREEAFGGETVVVILY
ncbi:MAG: hypothetical protein ABIW85_02615 [Variovorax sp.]